MPLNKETKPDQMVRLVFEQAYKDVASQHFSKYITGGIPVKYKSTIE